MNSRTGEMGSYYRKKVIEVTKEQVENMKEKDKETVKEKQN